MYKHFTLWIQLNDSKKFYVSCQPVVGSRAQKQQNHCQAFKSFLAGKSSGETIQLKGYE